MLNFSLRLHEPATTSFSNMQAYRQTDLKELLENSTDIVRLINVQNPFAHNNNYTYLETLIF